MAKYELSPDAEKDLLEIALYGLTNYGLEQSEAYRDLLKTRFQELADNPLHYPAVDHIRRGYRRSVCGVHSIYYRQKWEIVEIMRIIYRQDTKNL